MEIPILEDFISFHFISFHFIFTSFWRVTIQHCWFSRGPPLKEKQYIYIQLKYSDYNTTKKKRKKYHKSYIYTLQEKVNGAKRAWLLASF